MPDSAAHGEPNDDQSIREVPIRDRSIRLGQFLKLADLVDSGAEAKDAVAFGQVSVNGVLETRRGRQLVAGDRVSLGTEQARVSTEVGLS